MQTEFKICLNVDKDQLLSRNGGKGAELALETEGPHVQQQTSDQPGHGNSPLSTAHPGRGYPAQLCLEPLFISTIQPCSVVTLSLIHI